LQVVKWLLFKTNRLNQDFGSEGNPIQNANQRSCLHFAAKHGENEILRFILSEMHKRQLSIDIQDINGNTAAHLAAKYNHLNCLQVHLNYLISFLEIILNKN
jgi:ankyrin repeat protein